jgi:hypothetical protein
VTTSTTGHDNNNDNDGNSVISTTTRRGFLIIPSEDPDRLDLDVHLEMRVLSDEAGDLRHNRMSNKEGAAGGGEVRKRKLKGIWDGVR